jgi:hypothetical protein
MRLGEMMRRGMEMKRDMDMKRGMDMRQGTGMDTILELTETVTRHDWEEVDDSPDGFGTRLSLSASLGSRLGSTIRGTVYRPTVFHHRLAIRDWELTGPPELPEAWTERVRFALAQLRLRAAGEAHTIPNPGGRWDVTVRQRWSSAGAEAVQSGLTPQLTFTPTQIFVDASTGGAGLVCLFGDGPVETHSARFGFVVGAGGTVAFDRLDPATQVPQWAQEPAREAARLAFELLQAADRQLSNGITTGQY